MSKYGIGIFTILLLSVFALAAPVATAQITGLCYVDDDNTTGPWTGAWWSPFETIQDAIDNTAGPMTIKVRNGTYGKISVVDRTYVLNIISDRNNPDQCIIDANNTGSCVYIENANVKLKGFKVINGLGTYWDDSNEVNHVCGAGVFAEPASWITIDNCKILDNQIIGLGVDQVAEGGGVYIRPSNTESGVVATIQNCTFENNCVVPNLSSPDTTENCWGGALFCSGLATDSIIQMNTFEENYSDDYGGAICMGNCATVILDSNQLYSNYTRMDQWPGNGMAICASGFNASNGKLIMINNMIGNNGQGTTADSRTDAVCIVDVPHSYISNNTIANNDAYNSSAVIIKAHLIDCAADVFNSIFYDNTVGDSEYQLKLIGHYNTKYLTTEVAFNSVKGGTDGYYNDPDTGMVISNLDVYNDDDDPGFNDATNNDFEITTAHASECIDAGVAPDDPVYSTYTSDAYIPSWDYKSSRRPLDGDGSQTSEWDIGAHELVPAP